MFAIAAITCTAAVILFTAPALCLQLLLRRCWGVSAASQAEVPRAGDLDVSDAAPLSSRVLNFVNPDPLPQSQRCPLSA